MKGKVIRLMMVILLGTFLLLSICGPAIVQAEEASPDDLTGEVQAEGMLNGNTVGIVAGGILLLCLSCGLGPRRLGIPGR